MTWISNSDHDPLNSPPSLCPGRCSICVYVGAPIGRYPSPVFLSCTTRVSSHAKEAFIGSMSRLGNSPSCPLALGSGWGMSKCTDSASPVDGARDQKPGQHFLYIDFPYSVGPQCRGGSLGSLDFAPLRQCCLFRRISPQSWMLTAVYPTRISSEIVGQATQHKMLKACIFCQIGSKLGRYPLSDSYHPA